MIDFLAIFFNLSLLIVRRPGFKANKYLVSFSTSIFVTISLFIFATIVI